MPRTVSSSTPPPRRLRSRSSRLAAGAVAAALAVVSIGAVAAPAAAQTGDDAVRVVARKLADGRIEFGIQQRNTDNTWTQRQLPRARFFPTTATTGRWLNSSPLNITTTTPTEPAPAQQTYTAIAAGSSHSCALRADGTITCWGNNWAGQTDAPAGNYTAITNGNAHSCALRTDGTITCWGDDRAGQTDGPAD